MNKAKAITVSSVIIADHIHDVEPLRQKTAARALVGDRELALAGAEPFSGEKAFRVGALDIETRLTWGHVEGDITYVLQGLSRPVAIVGDVIFAGSVGGGKVSYADVLRTVRDEILNLPTETVLGSGHGPLTTVAEEKLHDPFFAL